VFGISRDVPDNAVFLNNGETIAVAYAAAHTVVLYDVVENQQAFLQVSPCSAQPHASASFGKRSSAAA
jgi:hypothetical protein